MGFKKEILSYTGGALHYWRPSSALPNIPRNARAVTSTGDVSDNSAVNTGGARPAL